VRFLPLALLTAVLLARAAPAVAAAVAIVQPAHPAPEVAETLSRLRGELLSVGLEVTVVEGPAGRRLAGADAVIDLVSSDAGGAVEVWLAKSPPGQPEVIRVTVEPNTKNASGLLALRTIEVLRANLFDVDWAARGRSDQPAAAPTTTLPAPGEAGTSSGDAASWGLEVGAAALTSLDGVGPALLPTIRAGWAARPSLVFQAALAGLGSRPTVATFLGTARVSQQYGLLGGHYRFRADKRLWPFLSLSLGVLHTSVAGQASSSANDGYSPDQWSFLLDGGIGIGMRLGGRYYVTLAADAQMAAPYVAIRFVDAVGATSGRPNLLLVLTMGAWL
jgi:hypothetical protein